MDDLISRQAAIDEVKALRPFALVLDDGCELYTNYDVEYVISHLPSVPERKKGKWELADLPYCSACGETFGIETDYCPHCGAEMECE